jgi:hypothetical protein
MWRRAVRWVYQVWPNDPESGMNLPENETVKGVPVRANGVTHNED